MKGMEQSNIHVQRIHKKCPYVGYDSVRRGANAPVLSMSTILRVWAGSRPEVPTSATGSAASCVDRLDEAEASDLIEFLTLCYSSWRRDAEYTVLWGSLNLVLCAWLYRRVVVGSAGKGTSRATKMSADAFRRGLLSLSAKPDYMEYLVGRRVSDRDRAPAYNRLKTIFAARHITDTSQRLLLPSPSWAHGSGSSRASL